MSAVKAELRRAVRARRDALPTDDRAAFSARIRERIAQHPRYADAGCLLVYAAMRSEVDLGPLIEAALAEGRQVAFPNLDWEARCLVPVRLPDLACLVTGRYQVPLVPPERCEPVPPEAIDLVLTPGVAFDAQGRRLGYGGGFYDRLLPQLPSAAARWGIGFEAQVLDEVPADETDQRMDAVVTELRWIETGARP